VTSTTRGFAFAVHLASEQAPQVLVGKVLLQIGKAALKGRRRAGMVREAIGISGDRLQRRSAFGDQPRRLARVAMRAGAGEGEHQVALGTEALHERAGGHPHFGADRRQREFARRQPRHGAQRRLENLLVGDGAGPRAQSA
jgi:hypothetical protein